MTMPTSLSKEQRIRILFDAIKTTALPEPGYLAAELKILIDKNKQQTTIRVDPAKISAHFASAAVEMWLRGIHSFLISSSLTKVSPIWASVSGYYASHYCVRGLAHLHGFFQLFSKRRFIRIEITGGKHYCHVEKKGADDGEHKFYWKIVKEETQFKDDDFFTKNEDDGSKDAESDAGHRNIANYYDHIDRFSNFHPLDEEFLKTRITTLSKISLSSPPIPRKDKYPDVDTVQLVAYHRLIKFRDFLDEILGENNHFWKIYRNPTWCAEYLKYQVTPLQNDMVE
jgi:hypothetical protein